MDKEVFSTCWSLYFVLTLYSLSITVSSSSHHFGLQSGKRVKEELNYLQGESVSMLHCAFQCMRNNTCMTASVNDDGSCNLSGHKINGTQNQSLLQDATSWTVMSKKPCPFDADEVGDACYISFPSPTGLLMRHTEAMNVCAELGGRLPEPRTNATLQLLSNYGTEISDGFDVYWLGLRNTSGQYVWMSDGEAPSYTHWFNGGTQGFECAGMSGGFWGATVCSATLYVICEV